MDGPAGQTMDQFSLLEALGSLHFWRLTFQFVHCRSFRVRQRPYFNCDKQLKKLRCHFVCLLACMFVCHLIFSCHEQLKKWQCLFAFLSVTLYFLLSFWPLYLLMFWHIDLLTYRTFWPSEPFDLWNLWPFYQMFLLVISNIWSAPLPWIKNM